jgi:glutamyl-tRNA reductase
MTIVCYGISHQSASVELRERFAVPDSLLPESLVRLSRVPGVEEGVILSTCNRTELYLVGPDSQIGPELLLKDFLPKVAPSDADHLFRLNASQTVRHLFRVASGLESMVIGETEIFGQVKRAYDSATKAGVTGKFLHKLFQRAFQVAKQVRSSTSITRGSTSVGSVAVELASQIFGELSGCKVMILGAGETSERTARALQSRGTRQLFVSNRSHERAEGLAKCMGGRAIRFDGWEKEFHDLDILISSTAAPHVIVTVEKLQPVLRNRRDRPLFIIDLAMPRDVEPAVNSLDGVYLYDLDSLQGIADGTLAVRRNEIAQCEELIDRHASEFQLWLERVLERSGPVLPIKCPRT